MIRERVKARCRAWLLRKWLRPSPKAPFEGEAEGLFKISVERLNGPFRGELLVLDDCTIELDIPQEPPMPTSGLVYRKPLPFPTLSATIYGMMAVEWPSRESGEEEE